MRLERVPNYVIQDIYSQRNTSLQELCIAVQPAQEYWSTTGSRTMSKSVQPIQSTEYTHKHSKRATIATFSAVLDVKEVQSKSLHITSLAYARCEMGFQGHMQITLFLTLFYLALVLPTGASIEELTCGVWLAKSTIPDAGVGMFAGKDFAKNEDLLPAGDVVIPVVDMAIHQSGHGDFLWDEYTWDGKELNLGLEGLLSDELSASSPGFGSAINCFMDLTNVEEVNPIQSYEGGLHRFKDPGAGAFSPYWNRTAWASQPIKTGQELFVSCKFLLR